MKSGPTLNAWTFTPRRARAARIDSVTVVLPDPECVPAITTAGTGTSDVPGLPEKVGVGSVIEMALRRRLVVEHRADEDQGGAGDPGPGDPVGEPGHGRPEDLFIGPAHAVGY